MSERYFDSGRIQDAVLAWEKGLLTKQEARTVIYATFDVLQAKARLTPPPMKDEVEEEDGP